MQDVSPQSQLIAVDLVRYLVGGVSVGTTYPRDAPPQYIVVQRVGGVLRNPITDEATLSIAVYADTQGDAERIAAGVWHALYRQEWAGVTIRGHMVRGWKSAGAPQMLIDPDRPERPRFQFAGALLVSTLMT